ncbi:ABC transporter permease [Paenibacillus arenilitoris]|uniref:Sugar ABC transporter permease n=1 Tax=Paenibacillus arenilitoris TaxID=2772299 RepID=A0A927CGM4_9BACL|nr:ABC transporter permease subunit [Paenibacillus arenilitoris]MBD2867195.1 sugar ABC transporter permease [Paenibacillus arenilitoris]
MQDRSNKLMKRMLVRYELYLMLLLPLVWFIIFQYVPMYGVQIAFREFMPNLGFLGSPWVGFEHFERFFSSYYFERLLWNTLSISLFQTLVAFPIPIFLALLIHEIQNKRMRKLLQNVTYMPHFISIVVIVGMLNLFLSSETGFVNHVLSAVGIEPIAFMERADWFKTVLISSGVWQNMGWQSIIYIAALSGLDPQLYEAAKIDGASRWQRVMHVSVPGILPTIIILLILDIGHFMNVGFEKILLMQNELNMEASDVISTFIYRNGILKGDFSYSASIGLFNALINFILLIVINAYARRKTETSLW